MQITFFLMSENIPFEVHFIYQGIKEYNFYFVIFFFNGLNLIKMLKFTLVLYIMVLPFR